MVLTTWASRFLTGVLRNVRMNMKATDGSTYSADFVDTATVKAFNWIRAIGIGKSKEAETPDDFELKDLYIKSTDLTIGDVVETGTEIHYVIRANFTITETVTIWELGVYGVFQDVDGYGREFLVYRGVLGVGKDLEAGDIFTVEFKTIIPK